MEVNATDMGNNLYNTSASEFERPNTNVSERPSAKALEISNPTKSTGSAAVYFRVPASIILDSDENERRVSAFSFFSMRRDLDNSVTFTLNNMAKWLGKKPDRHSGGTNENLAECISYLARRKYISLSGKVGNTSDADAMVDLASIADECDHSRFAVIYSDELRKIMDCNPKGSDAILLVFAWLRMRIPRRRNKLFPEEVGIKGSTGHDDDVAARRKANPDAYDCYIYEIADEVGLSDRIVSNSISTLKELGLIYSEQLPKTSVDGKWRSNQTVFCNMYKRENGSLLESGESYYMREVENKKMKIFEYHRNMRRKD